MEDSVVFFPWLVSITRQILRPTLELLFVDKTKFFLEGSITEKSEISQGHLRIVCILCWIIVLA